MSAIDETIQAVNSAKQQYEQAALGVTAAVKKAEETANLLSQVGADAMVEAIGEVKSSLEGVTTSTGALTSSLDDAAKALEAAKG